MTKLSSQSNELLHGQIWFHLGNKNEPYKVLEIISNATSYESNGIIGESIVVYEQEFDGKIAKKGTRWGRLLNDFLKNFVLKKV